MLILGIDPGPEKSGYAIWDTCQTEIIPKFGVGVRENGYIIDIASGGPHDILAIEMIASYGMPVGKSIFETCVWIGRFIQAATRSKCYRATRKEICLHLCNSPRGKDATIRQALIDRFPATGGGKCPQIGIKAAKGPLYGVKGDAWSALAVALYCADVLLMENTYAKPWRKT